MKLRSFITHVAADVRAVRTRKEAFLGIASVFACTTALLVILVFTGGFYKFLDHCFFRAKPVISSVNAIPRSRDLIRHHVYTALESSSDKRVEDITWVSTLDTSDLQFWRNADQRFERDEPVVWGVPAKHCSLLLPENGVQWLSGAPPVPSDRSDLRFEVWLNVKYLEKFENWSVQDIKSLLADHETGRSLPTTAHVHFSPVSLHSAGRGHPRPFQPGTLSLPLSGVFSLRESWAPDILVGFDVASAYYYQNRQRWHPSFVLQFNDCHGIPIIDQHTLKTTELDDREVLTLPNRTALLSYETLAEDDLTPFRLTSVAVREYRRPDVRVALKQSFESPIPFGTLTRSDEVLASLEARKPNRLIEQIEEYPRAKSRSATLTRTSERSWSLRDRGADLTLRITDNDETIDVESDYRWQVSIPSDTASAALKRVTRVVDFYSSAAKLTVLILGALITTLFGIGYIHRKRVDIGILKTQGIHPMALGLLYSAQVAWIAFIGFLAAVLLFVVVVAGWLEPYAAEVLEELTPTYVTEGKVMELGVWQLAECTGWIGLAVPLGCVYPSLMAMTLDPIEDLKTGV